MTDALIIMATLSAAAAIAISVQVALSRYKPAWGPVLLPQQRERHRAYLVLHLDLRHSPPVATFACIYSNSARDLTMTGAPEARADLYMVECDTFEEALREMERIQPLYFPWVTPLLVRRTYVDSVGRSKQ